MDFFEYASVASYFTDTDWVYFLTGGLCFAIVFVFQAIALYTIACREGYKNKWMAFIPFINTYYVGVCAQKNKFYKIDTKKIGIAAAVFEFVLFALYVLYHVGCDIILRSGIAPMEITSSLGKKSYFFPLEVVASINPDLVWCAWIYDYMGEYILSILELLYLLVEVSLLICFFQTYACRRYVIFSIASILFPIQGILFFVVRNNKGINYREFLRAEQARQYRIYQQYQQQNYNQNPYNQNPYNRNPYDGTSRPDAPSGTRPDDPFSEFGTGGNSDNRYNAGNSGSYGGSDYSGNSSSGSQGGSPFDDFN